MKYVFYFASGHYTSPLRTGNPEIGTFANTEDPDEMHHDATFN